jgi:hypothetical protein
MATIVRCTSCHGKTRVDDATAGSTVRCTHCGAVLSAPTDPDAASAPQVGPAVWPSRPYLSRPSPREKVVIHDDQQDLDLRRAIAFTVFEGVGGSFHVSVAVEGGYRRSVDVGDGVRLAALIDQARSTRPDLFAELPGDGCCYYCGAYLADFSQPGEFSMHRITGIRGGGTYPGAVTTTHFEILFVAIPRCLRCAEAQRLEAIAESAVWRCSFTGSMLLCSLVFLWVLPLVDYRPYILVAVLVSAAAFALHLRGMLRAQRALRANGQIDQMRRLSPPLTYKPILALLRLGWYPGPSPTMASQSGYARQAGHATPP